MVVGGIVAALVLVIVVSVVYIFTSLEPLIQEAVEKYGSEVTKAEVKLAKVELDATSGKGSLGGLTVGNPAGFSTPSAFELGMVSVSVDTGTITCDTIVIKEVVIDKPSVTYELGGDGSNIAAIQKNIDDYMKAHGLAGDGKPAAEKPEEEGGGPKLIIENLYVRGGTVGVSATILQGKSMSADLPDIHLEDIGKEDDGASPAEVAEQVLTSISEGATKAVGDLGIGETLDSLKNVLGGATEGVGKTVTEGAESVGKKLKGLLGN